MDISADAGKAKLILIKPDNSIEILKEVIVDGENHFNGDIPFHCDVGLNRIKFVGSDFKGQFKLKQTNNLFNFGYHDELIDDDELLDSDGLFGPDGLFGNN